MVPSESKELKRLFAVPHQRHAQLLSDAIHWFEEKERGSLHLFLLLEWLSPQFSNLISSLLMLLNAPSPFVGFGRAEHVRDIDRCWMFFAAKDSQDICFFIHLWFPFQTEQITFGGQNYFCPLSAGKEHARHGCC